MGFEQLAALRDQLAAEARKNAPAQKKPSGNGQKASGQHRGAPQPQARKEGVPGNGQEAHHARPATRDQKARDGKPREAKARDPRAREVKEVDPVILAISRLQRRYPKTFPKHPEPKFPLKLGVHKDLIQHAKELQLTEEEIKNAIKTWCEGRRYWTAMVEGAARLDLQGEANGVVTAEEALRAKRLAARARAKAHPRKPAAKQADAATPDTSQQSEELATAAAAEVVIGAEALPHAEPLPHTEALPHAEAPATVEQAPRHDDTAAADQPPPATDEPQA